MIRSPARSSVQCDLQAHLHGPPGRSAGLLVLSALAIGANPFAAAAQEAPPADVAPASIANPSHDIDAAAWLAGCWEAASADGLDATEEFWMSPRAGIMVGMSRSVRDGQVRGYELLTIRAENGQLVLHAVPSRQAPTDFSAVSVAAGRLEFANPDHDFPQKIVYARIGEDSVHASVFALLDDSEPAFLLPYRRVACPA